MRLRALALIAFASFTMIGAAHGEASGTASAHVAFPRDNGAHAASRDEWWRCIGHVRARDGRRFDYAVTFFRFTVGSAVPTRGTAKTWDTRSFYSATLAIVDERSGRFERAERFARDALGLGAARSDRLGLRVIDWTLDEPPATGADETAASGARPERARLHAGNADTGLELRAFARKSAITLGPHEYALTSWRAAGFVTVAGERVAVEGSSWFDHAYGTNDRSPDEESGWDRFSVQLDDGREIWLEVVRRGTESSANVTHAILVERDGTPRTLAASAYSFESHSPSGWRSHATGARYPNLWALTVPSAGLMLSLEPVLSDQEIVPSPGGVAYWNGAVDVYDITPGTPGKRLGAGYAELTGYASPLRL